MVSHKFFLPPPSSASKSTPPQFSHTPAPYYFPRCHPLSPPRTPHVTPPTPVDPGTPPAARKQVSHRRFRLWSAPNPASAPRCSPLFVAPPQYTLNPRSAVGRDPGVRRCPDSRSKLFGTLCIRSTFLRFPAPRKARLSTNAPQLSSACLCSVSSACFPHQRREHSACPKQTGQSFGQAATGHFNHMTQAIPLQTTTCTQQHSIPRKKTTKRTEDHSTRKQPNEQA
ncbi:hypothetical protein PGT21_026022 [Puccinia graminis f. sp. tritici]|uniref:Uncharacterized protein n=1 Tax=Puccinia graminis f. sp. tritici TaxID=56615 RepID=A0A5B0PS09_PUCGR|nr:hypothetical protein PGT21_026022 [Puccinia graminis f. sp. tritici]